MAKIKAIPLLLILILYKASSEATGTQPTTTTRAVVVGNTTTTSNKDTDSNEQQQGTEVGEVSWLAAHPSAKAAGATESHYQSAKGIYPNVTTIVIGRSAIPRRARSKTQDAKLLARNP